MDQRKSNTDSTGEESGPSEEKRRTYGNVFNKFADMTSMSGVGYIKNSKLIIARVMWSILLLCSIIALTIHLWNSLDQFYSYPKTAKINLGFANLPFPEVTICNVNPVSQRRLDAYDSENVAALKRLVEALKPSNLAPEQFNDSLSYDDIADLYSHGSSSGDYYDNFWSDYGSSMFYDNYEYAGGFYDYYNTYYNYDSSGYDGSGSGSGDFYGSGSGSGDGDGSGSGNGVKKRRKRYTEMFNDFNFSDFDPTFEEWFRHDKAVLLADDEYGADVDQATKVDALFRKTFMALARWERGRLGHNITKMLLKCTFNGRKCDDKRKLFRLHQTPEYGNCWTLSSPKLIALDSGPGKGLTMVINLQSVDYLKGITHGYGARIQIHNKGAYPDPYQDGISIAANMETNIGLKLVTFERLSGKYGDCEEGDEFKRKYNRPYTRRTCQIFCTTTKIIEACHCFDDHSEEVAYKTGQFEEGLKACSTVEEYNCVHRIEVAFERKELSCSCRNPCKESTYMKSITSSQWPTDDHATLLRAGICAEDAGACKSFLDRNNTISSIFNNFLKLNIYYEDLNYEAIKEEPDIEIAQILSDVGGAVGLWIGLSVMSFCEVIQLLIELCKVTRHKMREKVREDRKKSLKRKANFDDESPKPYAVPGSKFGDRNGSSSRVELNKFGNGSFTGNGNVFSTSNKQNPFDYSGFEPYGKRSRF